MYTFISSLLTLAAAIPASTDNPDPVIIDPNAWNFVVNAVYASNVHLNPIYVDSEKGLLTTANTARILALGFDDSGHATDPYTAERLYLTGDSPQATISTGTGDEGFSITDGILAKDGTTGWGLCPKDDGSYYIYWVKSETPCADMIPLTIAAIPIRVSV